MTSRMTGPSSDETSEPLQPGRRPALVVAALAALALAAVVVVIAAAHVTPAGHGHPASSAGQSRITVPTQPPPSASVAPAHHQRKPSVTPLAVVFLVAGLLAALAGLLIIIWLIRTTLRRRSLPRMPRLSAPDLDQPAQLVAHQVGSAVDRALAELGAGGPVDDAIIRCWLQLEAATDEAGVPRDASDTPEEAIARVFAAGRVQPGPLRTLADLYREARFSRHRMTDDDAAAARAALTSIVHDLHRGELETAPVAAQSAERTDGGAG